MWQRFTERARKCMFCAQEEAAKLCQSEVSTEHLLLGLLRQTSGVAGRILLRMGMDLEGIRTEIMAQASRNEGRLGRDLRLARHAKRAIRLAHDEARRLNNNYLGTEHLLLGLIAESDGLAGRVLRQSGASLEKARREFVRLQESSSAQHRDTQEDTH